MKHQSHPSTSYQRAFIKRAYHLYMPLNAFEYLRYSYFIIILCLDLVACLDHVAHQVLIALRQLVQLRIERRRQRSHAALQAVDRLGPSHQPLGTVLQNVVQDEARPRVAGVAGVIDASRRTDYTTNQKKKAMLRISPAFILPKRR